MEEKKSKNREYRVVIKFKCSSETIEKGKELARKALKLMGLEVVSVKHISGLRSESQNNALHLWLDQVAEEAEKRGLTIDMLITKPTEVPITAEILKDLARFTGKKMYGKKSTAKWTKAELSEIVKLLDKSFLEKLQINIPFPNIELLIDRDQNNN